MVSRIALNVKPLNPLIRRAEPRLRLCHARVLLSGIHVTVEEVC
jgi:hypothetical protein